MIHHYQIAVEHNHQVVLIVLILINNKTKTQSISNGSFGIVSACVCVNEFQFE